MNDRLSTLIHRFRQQQKFAAAYAPLYAALFGTCAEWLEEGLSDPVANWLVQAAEGRAAFDVTNLLAAGLHREVLMGSSEVFDLAAYYPTAAGKQKPRKILIDDTQEVSPMFKRALREAILARRDVLQSFIQTNTVQTNETGRGIAWLLPVCLKNWGSIHLIDLGASAGLNLVAEQRSFHFMFGDDARPFLHLGNSLDDQFVIQTTGATAKGSQKIGKIPAVLSRTGCDLHPFHLQTAVDEQTLSSFVWADHVERLQRLREGIAAFHETMASRVPIHLHEVRLPEEVPVFLKERNPESQDPVVIYNTYIKMYLVQKGAALREHITTWAEAQKRPVLWIQWEPANCLGFDSGPEPEYGWLAWTLDYWDAGKHEKIQIGWVHPHGQQLQLLPELWKWAPDWQDAL